MRPTFACALLLVACGSPGRAPATPAAEAVAPPAASDEPASDAAAGAPSTTEPTSAPPPSETPADERPPMTTLTADLHLDADPSKGEFPSWVRLAKSDAPPEPKRSGPLCKPGEWVAVDIHKSVRCEEYVVQVAKYREAERAAAIRRASLPGDVQYLSTHLFEARPSRCRKAGQPIGNGSVELTISPEGHITNVVLEPPFARSLIGDCITRRYKALNLGRFSGPPVTFKTTFHVE